MNDSASSDDSRRALDVPSGTVLPGGSARAHAAGSGPLPILLAIVAGWVLACYWPVLTSRALSIDDDLYVTENPLVRSPSWEAGWRVVREVLKPSAVSGYYQPLTMISLMVDSARGGGVDDLGVFRQTNLALHVLNTVLTGVLLYFLFGRPWVAAAVSLLFGLHPLTIEPVASLAERKTMLATFFALICLVSYVRYTRRGSGKWYAVSLVGLVLALLSKPTTVPLPVLLLLLDWWPLRRLSWRALREKVPFFAIAALGASITLVSQSQAAFVGSPEKRTVTEIIYVVCHNIVLYLHKAVWPVPVGGNYVQPAPLSAENPTILIGLVGTGMLIVLLLVTWRWTRAVLTGWLFFFIAIAPTMGVVGFTNVVAADKYAYLPLLGFLLVLAAGAGQLWDARRSASVRRLGRGVVVVTALLCAGLETVATRADLAYWHDSISLYRHMVRVSPNSSLAHSNLGVALYKAGQVDAAIAEFRRGIQASPRFHLPRFNLANVLAERGDVRQALAEYAELLKVCPDHFLAWDKRAALLIEVGRYNDALDCVEQMLRLRPNSPLVWNNKGWLLERLGRTAEARACYRQARRLSESP